MRTYYWWWALSGMLWVAARKPKSEDSSTIRAGSIFEAELRARDASMMARNTRGYKHKYKGESR